MGEGEIMDEKNKLPSGWGDISEDDEEYEAVCDAYDEWLDNADFDEM